MTKINLLRTIYAVCVGCISLLFSLSANAQYQVLADQQVYTQNFNGNLYGENNTDVQLNTRPLPDYWVSNRTVMKVSNGSVDTGALYSFGDNSSTERALGSLASGSAQPTFGFYLQNSSGAPIASIEVDYYAEQWRRAQNNQHQIYTFQYAISSTPTSITDGSLSWVDVPALNMNTIHAINTTPSAMNGNDSANRLLIQGAINIPSLLQDGQYLILRWVDSNDPGTDHGMGVDDLTFKFNAGEMLPPVITSDLTVIGTVGTPFSYQITATFAPSSYEVIGLPAGLVYNATTGLISGTLTPEMVGTFHIGLIATNSVGFDEQTMTLTITDPGPTMTVRGVGTNIIQNGNMVPNPLINTMFAETDLASFQEKTYEIHNTGTSNLILTGTPRVSISGSHADDFVVMAMPNATIGAGNYSNFVIRFQPLAPGIRTAVVTIQSNIGEYTFAIQGTGKAPNVAVYGNGRIIEVNSLIPTIENHTHFGNVHVSAGTLTRQFFIKNIGGDNLVLNLPITISGADATDFTITPVSQPAEGILPADAVLLSITFDPSSEGLKQAVVSFGTNVVGKNPYTFAISGVGTTFTECVLGAYTNYRVQNFESTGSTWDYTISQDAASRPFTIAGGVNYGSSRTATANMSIGNASLQVRGPYGNSNVNKAKTTILFDTVDLSSFTEAELRVGIGAFSTNTTQGLDVSDLVTIHISVDGGITWSSEVQVSGNDNSIWTIQTSPNRNAFYRGINFPDKMQAPKNSINQGARMVSLANLPLSSQFRMKIDIELDLQTEVWVIDNISIRTRNPLTTTWNGTAWTNGRPTESVKAIFNGNYNSSVVQSNAGDPLEDGNVTACECTINPNRTVTITPDHYLQIGKTIENNGTLIVESGGSVIQHDNYATNFGSGVYSMLRTTNLRKLDYVYWSSPSEGFAVTSVSPTTPVSKIWKWQPTVSGQFGTWINTTETMAEGVGYIVRGGNSISDTSPSLFTANFIGTFRNGLITPEIQRGNYTGIPYESPTNSSVMVTNIDDNLNLIGNPYPSAIDADAFLIENDNIEGSVRLWTHGNLPNSDITDPFYGTFQYNYDVNDYIVYNLTGPSSGPSGFNGKIASGQAFFVIMNDGPAATSEVVFKNNMRSVSYNNQQFYRVHQADKRRLWIDLVSDENKAVRTLVGYVDGATESHDRLYDAVLREDGGTSFYSVANETAYTVQGRPLSLGIDDVVQLGFKVSQSGNYHIAIAELEGMEDMEVYLIDKQFQVSHKLKDAPYSFYSDAGRFDDRFELRYTSQALGDDEMEYDETVKVYRNSDYIYIDSDVLPILQIQWYDLLGRNLYRAHDVNMNQHQFYNNAPMQTYIVRIQLQNGKWMIRKMLL